MAKKKFINKIWEWIKSLVPAIAIALFIRIFIVEPFKIPSGSMKPTLLVGDRIFVNKFIYRFKEPERGDIVVFKYPEDPKKYFIKRLAAKGGDVLVIKDGNLIVNGKPLEKPDAFKYIYYYNNMGRYGRDEKPIKVTKNHYFFLGDNSAFSKDSRYWGFVPDKYIVGKAFFRFWPPWRIGLLKYPVKAKIF
jgi:signal peptidase I